MDGSAKRLRRTVISGRAVDAIVHQMTGAAHTRICSISERLKCVSGALGLGRARAVRRTSIFAGCAPNVIRFGIMISVSLVCTRNVIVAAGSETGLRRSLSWFIHRPLTPPKKMSRLVLVRSTRGVPVGNIAPIMNARTQRQSPRQHQLLRQKLRDCRRRPRSLRCRAMCRPEARVSRWEMSRGL